MDEQEVECYGCGELFAPADLNLKAGFRYCEDCLAEIEDAEEEEEDDDGSDS